MRQDLRTCRSRAGDAEPPALASACSRAAIFTPSPNRSPARTITSPTWTPMRKLIWRLSGNVELICHGTLSLRVSPDSIHGALKLREHAVACRVGDPPPVVPDEPVQDSRRAVKASRVATSSAPMRRQ